ncbi:DUF6516 family protein [Paenibacillus lentus]
MEREFRSIIMDSSDGDGSGLLSSRSFTRWTLTFHDGSKLYITEHLNQGIIQMYFYNWVSISGEVLAKFHSEPHDEDKRYQTVTEPFHIHPPEEAKIHNSTRHPNFYHQELPQILEAIFIYMLASKKI